MTHRPALFATVALIAAAAAAPAGATAYDFSTVAAGTVTPLTLDGATFSSPSDPGAFTVGASGSGLSTPLSTVPVLSSGGFVSTLDIAFAAPQTAISFAFDLDAFAAGDTLTLTPNVGLPTTVASAAVDGDLFPSGALSYTGAAFTSVAISSVDGFEIGSLSTSVPEPASMALLATGLLSLASLRRRA